MLKDIYQKTMYGRAVAEKLLDIRESTLGKGKEVNCRYLIQYPTHVVD